MALVKRAGRLCMLACRLAPTFSMPQQAPAQHAHWCTSARLHTDKIICPWSFCCRLRRFDFGRLKMGQSLPSSRPFEGSR